MTNPLKTIEMMDEAFNAGDVESLLSFYEEDAAIVLEPGRVVTGKPELRRAFEWVLVNMKGTARQEKTHVIETGDIALFTSKWNYTGTSSEGEPFSRDSYASVILRKQADGRWRVVVDNSWGPAVLEAV